VSGRALGSELSFACVLVPDRRQTRATGALYREDRSPDQVAFAKGGAINPTPVVHSNPVPAAGARSALCDLYGVRYQSLVRLAAVVVQDAETAEEVVQDSFMALYGAWSRLHETSKARAYLRQSVVNRAMSVLRHRAVEKKYAAALASEESTEQEIIILLERSALVAALRRLPARQREAVVLRFYADLPEADVAKAMGISRGAVKSHVARGVSTLRGILDDSASRGYGQPR
jgi:RNA polymerase sigma-70 factor (sigma-E family)